MIYNKPDNYFVVSVDRQTFLGVELTANLRDTSPLNNSLQVISQLLVFFFTDIRLDWEAYNILPQDSQLLDMLVFIGQPLPVFKDGQEVVPAVKEEDCYQREEEKPFIQVKLREHDGICANRPFDVTPSQQVRESWVFHGLYFVFSLLLLLLLLLLWSSFIDFLCLDHQGNHMHFLYLFF